MVKAVGSAVISGDGKYRYKLTRELEGFCGTTVFCMLNPSTADDVQDDPTIRRCVDFANRWLSERLVVVNLFAIRSTDPNYIFADGVTDPEGPDNDMHIRRAAEECYTSEGTFICAWGNAGIGPTQHWRRQFLAERAMHVLGVIERGLCRPKFLRLNGRQGHPGHPLYLPANAMPQDFPADYRIKVARDDLGAL